MTDRIEQPEQQTWWQLCQRAALLSEAADAAKHQSAEQLRTELRVASEIVRTARRELPRLVRQNRSFGEWQLNELLRQLGETDWSVRLSAAGAHRRSVKIAIQDVAAVVPYLRNEEPDVRTATRALADLERHINHMIDEPDTEEWRRRVEETRPVVARIAYSVAIGLLATAATAPLLGDPILGSILISAVGLLVTAICSELLPRLPGIDPDDKNRAVPAKRHDDMIQRVGELGALLHLAYGPGAREDQHDKWATAVRRSCLAIAIMTIDIERQLDRLVWIETYEYVAALAELRTLLPAIQAATRADPLSDGTCVRLRELTSVLAAFRIPPDLLPRRARIPPPSRRAIIMETWADDPRQPAPPTADTISPSPVNDELHCERPEVPETGGPDIGFDLPGH